MKGASEIVPTKRLTAQYTHTETETYRNRNTQRHAHRDRHIGTETHTDTPRQTYTNTHLHSNTSHEGDFLFIAPQRSIKSSQCLSRGSQITQGRAFSPARHLWRGQASSTNEAALLVHCTQGSRCFSGQLITGRSPWRVGDRGSPWERSRCVYGKDCLQHDYLQHQKAKAGCTGRLWGLGQGRKKVLGSELSLDQGWTPGEVGNFFLLLCNLLGSFSTNSFYHLMRFCLRLCRHFSYLHGSKQMKNKIMAGWCTSFLELL